MDGFRCCCHCPPYGSCLCPVFDASLGAIGEHFIEDVYDIWCVGRKLELELTSRPGSGLIIDWPIIYRVMCSIIRLAESSPPTEKKRLKSLETTTFLQSNYITIFPDDFPVIMKRKTASEDSPVANGQPKTKKRALSNEEAAARFREGLFEPAELQRYTKEYAQSEP